MSRCQQAEGYSPRKHGQKCSRSCGSTVAIEVQMGGGRAAARGAGPRCIYLFLPPFYPPTQPAVAKAHFGLQDIVENKMDMASVLIQHGDD